VEIRYYIDPETELPHIHRHGIEETDVEDVLRRKALRRRRRRKS
jgi:hypothetical protein